MGEGSKRPTANAQGSALQLKLALRGASKPPVWRRLVVATDTRLDRLHDVIQTSMGWTDTHLHMFSTATGDYGVRDPELGFRNERNTQVGQFLKQQGDRISYTYDFGDGWEHDIVLEKRLNPGPEAHLPACTGGKGACHQKTAEGPAATPTSRPRLRTQVTKTTTTCSTGWVWNTQRSSIPPPSIWPRSTNCST